MDGDKLAGSNTYTQLRWWEVDLGADECVSEVLIYNRIDCCSERLSNSIVTLRSQGGTTLKQIRIDDATGKAEILLNFRSSCDQLLQQFHRVDEKLSIQGKWQGGSVTGVCKGWGTEKVRSANIVWDIGD